MLNSEWSKGIFAAFLLVCFAIVIVTPIGHAFIRALFSSQTPGGAPPLFSTRQWTLLAHSFGVAAGVTVLASFLGVSAALLLELGRPLGRGLLWCGLAVTLVTPGVVFAIAWIDIAGVQGLITKAVGSVPGGPPSRTAVYGITGAILVQSLSFYPLVAMATAVGIHRLDVRFEEAALLQLTRRRRLTGIILPLLGPSIATGAVAVFLFSVTEFTVPSLLQVQVYPVEIHTRYSAYHDLDGGILQSIPLIAMGLAGCVLWGLYLWPRRQWVGRESRRTTRDVSGASRFAVTIGGWLLVAGSAGLPMAVLVWRSLPLTSYVEAWSTLQGEIATSFVLTLATATIMTIFGMALAYLTRARAFRALIPLALLPYLVSGPALGIALIMLWNHGDVRAFVFDSSAVLVLGVAARYFFVPYIAAIFAFRQLAPSVLESAEVHGVPWYNQFMRVAAPLSAGWLAAAWGLSAVLVFGEVDVTLLVAPPGVTTVPVRIFGLMHYGPSRLVAALSVLVVVLMAGLAALAYGMFQLSRKVGYA